ncbi:SGNH/GDSL hydrolase family protein [Sphaerisporangium sp. TRM90804]|uniref:SGNH/GDSL hydrolase family protein n=1 Tax=Sphaerisporangium sp. TRM90804 TaxID=3031113 RepID=UPI00244BF466|nr:SGNH/GDSL hydrolase family protein [Sphaerisporangium sp. TRM90804]MDH2426146.1 SGNH/GDSL hydrolase family protein [Sphaerisporangium sp. TRM90804]
MRSPRLHALLSSVAAALALATALAVPSSASVRADARQAAPSGAAQAAGHGSKGWTGTWATSPQGPLVFFPGAPSNWSLTGFSGETVRQVVRISVGGALARVRLSNRYGSQPLRVAGATVAKAGDGAAILPGTVRPLRFGRSASTTIPAGADATSEPVALATAPLDRLTVTLYFAEPTGPTTFHYTGLTTTYRAAGDHRFDRGAAAFAGETSQSWYYLTGVDVLGGPRPAKGAVVAFGDSITDGADSTVGADNRYPDELAERLVAARKRIGVLNAGIGGNMVLTDSPCYAGYAGVNRFAADALDLPGVRTAIVLEGINDIGSAGYDLGCGPHPAVTYEQLVEGYRTLIRAAHARGVKIIGATMTPLKGADFYDTPENDALRKRLNDWIRTSGEFDLVVDLDRALGDPGDRDRLYPPYASPDKIHPNDAGMRAIAEAVDLSTL